MKSGAAHTGSAAMPGNGVSGVLGVCANTSGTGAPAGTPAEGHRLLVGKNKLLSC